jgi:hypothetical protein
MRVARLLLLVALLTAIGIGAKAQDITENATALIGNRLYTFAKTRTVQINTGDSSADNRGYVDRDLLLVPTKRRKDADTSVFEASSTQRFLAIDWKVCAGENGMALYQRVGIRHSDGSLRYRLLIPNLTAKIARGIAKDGEDQRDGVGWFLLINRWHGEDERYLDFIELASHEPDEIGRGSYDTKTGRMYLLPPPKITASSPRLPGEHFPQTRWRHLKPAEVDRMSYAQVRYAINEIYARHNHIFDVPEIYVYFRQFDWFRPGDRDIPRTRLESEELSSIERANLPLLRTRRNKLLGKSATWETKWEKDE